MAAFDLLEKILLVRTVQIVPVKQLGRNSRKNSSRPVSQPDPNNNSSALARMINFISSSFLKRISDARHVSTEITISHSRKKVTLLRQRFNPFPTNGSFPYATLSAFPPRVRSFKKEKEKRGSSTRGVQLPTISRTHYCRSRERKTSPHSSTLEESTLTIVSFRR